MRRGFTAPAAGMIQWIGLILICIIMLYVIINWASAGAHVQRAIEQGSLMYTIANSVNALSGMEDGQATRYLTSPYDINVECNGACSVTTAAYDQSGKRQKESNEVLILGSIKPVKLEKVNTITLTKKSGLSVILTGEQVGDVFGTQLQIPQISRMCISTDAFYRDLIKAASEKYNVEQELIAAVIIAESSWNPDDYRYEPSFQIEHLEGTNWEKDDAWLNDGKTIDDWFDENPTRINEKSGLNPEQLNLVAQTRISASYGLMQVMYTTAYISCGYRGEPEGLKDPAASIDCGTKYLRDKLDQYNNDNADAVSAYNAGSRAWKTNLANRQYTERVLGCYNAFKAC